MPRLRILCSSLVVALAALSCVGGPPSEAPGDRPASPAAADTTAPWARALGGVNREYAGGVAAGSGGALWVGGYFGGGSELGGVPLHGAGQSDAFLARLDADGEVAWAGRLGGRGADEAKALAAGPDGEAYLAGLFSDRADFDPGPGRAELTSAGSADAFVARIEADGRLAWVRRFGGPFGDVAHAVAVAEDGTVLIAGYFQGRAGFGAPGQDGPGAAGELVSAGGSDAFVAAFDRHGEPRWARRLGGPGFDEARAVAVTPGAVLAAGRFEGTAGVDRTAGGGEAVPSASSVGGSDAFALRLDPEGRPLRLVRFGGPQDDVAHAVALAGDRGWVAGQFSGTAAAGPEGSGRAVTSGGRSDAFLLGLDPEGALERVHAFGGPGDDFPFALASRVDGGLYVAGFSQDVPRPEADRGPRPTESFVVRLDAGLGESWRRTFTASEGIQILALTAPPGASAGPRVVGIFQGEAELDLGGGNRATLTARRKTDAFAAALEP